MSGTTVEEMIAFGQIMKNSSGRHYAQKSKTTAPNALGLYIWTVLERPLSFLVPLFLHLL